MPKIRQPHYESLQRYSQDLLITKDGSHYLVEGDNVLLVDEAIVISRKHVGYSTFPETRLKGNTYLARIIVTNQILDWMNRVA